MKRPNENASQGKWRDDEISVSRLNPQRLIENIQKKEKGE